MRFRLYPTLFLPLVLAACSSSSTAPTASTDDTGTANGDDTQPSDETGSDDVAEAPTPCGTNVGDVLCDLPVHGYLRNDTTGLASSVALSDFNVSDALAQGTQKYAFIFNTAFW